MQEQADHDDQHDNRDRPVKHDVVVKECQEPHEEVGQPRERAECAAPAHQVHDDGLHVQGLVGLLDSKDLPIQGPRIHADDEPPLASGFPKSRGPAGELQMLTGSIDGRSERRQYKDGGSK